MSEARQYKDLLEKLSLIDREWQGIKALMNPPPLGGIKAEEKDSQAASPVVSEIPQISFQAKRLKAGQKFNAIPKIHPSEAEAILEKVEVVTHEEMLKRLKRLEQQVRKITLLGSMFLGLLILTMASFFFLTLQSSQLARAPLASKSPDPIAAEPTLPVVKPAPGEPAQPVSEETNIKSPVPESIAKYVGSITSNKYHYPDCKWAGEIKPEKLMTFNSVEEAQKEGYRPCPACNPPRRD